MKERSKKIFIKSVIILMSLILISCGKEKNSSLTSTYPLNSLAKQWIEDIDYLKDNLIQNHSNVYHKISEEDFDKEFSDLKNDVPKLSDDQIKFRLAQIVASVGDAHTALNLGLEEGKSYYPLGVWWFGKELRVLAIDKGHDEVLGNSLVAINDIPIEEVMSKINTLISHENEQWLKVQNISYVIMPEVLKQFNITNGGEASFSFKDDKGKTIKLNLSPGVWNNKTITYASELMPQKPLTLQMAGSNPYENLYWYRYFPGENIMYFQYNVCMDKDTAKAISRDDYDKFPDFSKFSDDLIKELKEKNIDKFVIDLRYNIGGSSILMSDFVAKLYDIKKLNENGKIFVLTGRKTFSSGVMACMSLKTGTKAIFVGEPTGGNMNGYGEVKMITLPNSKLQVSYSTKYFNSDSSYHEGFTPDMMVEQTYNNYIAGIDDVYEAARNYKK